AAAEISAIPCIFIVVRLLFLADVAAVCVPQAGFTPLFIPATQWRGKPRYPSRLYGLRSFVPIHRALAEVRLIRHVARQRSMMSEHYILHHRFARSHRLKELPQVQTQIVVIVAFDA